MIKGEMHYEETIALLLSMVMLLSLAACSDDPTPSAESGKGAQSENNVVDLKDASPSPEKDFVVTPLSDTTCELTEYVGKDEIVVFPETVEGMRITEISAYCFRNTTSVKSIRLSDSVEVIGTAAFSFNKNIETVVFGKGVKRLGDSAFMMAEGIREIVLNDGLETIGESCFQGCTVEKLEIPASVTEIGEEALSWTCDTIIASADTAAARYALYNGIAFQDKDTGKTIGGDSGYQANLASDIILSFNGKETSVVGKNSAEIMDTFGVP